MEPPALPLGYSVKWITFLDARVPILTQPFDGPCSLLAVANIYLLLRRISLPTESSYVTHEEILNQLATHIQQNPLGAGPDAEYFVSRALDLLPALHGGMLVDPKHTACTAFGANDGADFFENAKIRLMHAWVVDPQGAPELGALLAAGKGLSHGQASERATAAEGAEGELLRAWVNLPEQATPHGVKCMMREMRRLELATLYKKNHFSVVLKRCACAPSGAGGQCACALQSIALCELVTAQAYLDTPVVWQTLEPSEACLKGAATLLSARFAPCYPEEPATASAAPPAAAVAAPSPLSSSASSAGLEVPEDWHSMSKQEQQQYMAAVQASQSSGESIGSAPGASAPPSLPGSSAPPSLSTSSALASRAGGTGWSGGGGGGGGGGRSTSSAQPNPNIADRHRQSATYLGDLHKQRRAREAARGPTENVIEPSSPTKKPGCCLQ